MIIAIYILVALIAMANLRVELCRALMMFQQNSYRPSRFRHWIAESGDSTSARRLCALLVFFIAMTPQCPDIAAVAMAAIFMVSNYISLRRKKYKKPLVLTSRAARILVTSFFLAAAIAGVAVLLLAKPGLIGALYTVIVSLLGCYCASLLLIVVANFILKPVEKSITRRYIKDAESILAQMPDLRIIGVTGSYGKTTTKHYLQRILSEQFETLMTPGSYNTTLGVVRTIREMLKPYHEVFIVEMGAKQPDDIAEICRLVHPQCGIITAVGPQHLESFKTIECVQATKFELADALPSNGLVLVNNDFDMIATRPVTNTRCLRYAVKNTDGANYVAENIRYSTSGTVFDMRRCADGHTIELQTRLVGECNVSNLLAAAAMAQQMGVPDERIKYAVGKIEQVEHRLSIKRAGSGLTIIDDAFNSNPVGSAMALDVLASMTTGKRILITPGMIELGEKEAELNEAFGKKAASCCDVAIVVGNYNREAITAGLREGGMPEDAIHIPDTFIEAQEILRRIAAPGDTVLYENDLPDTFK